MSLERYQVDYPIWHAAQVASGDIDPVYPVLRALVDRRGLGPEETAWLIFLHVAFYNPGSTLAAFEIVPSVDALPDDALGLAELGLLSLPCGVERRGHRDTRRLVEHLLALKATFREEGAGAWVERAVGRGTPREGWRSLGDALVGIRGNGRWASYKTTEMFAKIYGARIEAPDAGHQFSSGPRRGLEILEPFCPKDNSAATIAVLDLLTEGWSETTGDRDLAQIETSLCDFFSLSRGRYYLGHDIDGLLASWLDPRVSAYVSSDAWEARAAVFSPAFLGEVGGWSGVRTPLKHAYRDSGVILHLEEAML